MWADNKEQTETYIDNVPHKTDNHWKSMRFTFNEGCKTYDAIIQSNKREQKKNEKETNVNCYCIVQSKI